MKVGLVRHFKVKKDYPKRMFVSTDELIQWFAEYDSAEIDAGTIEIHGNEWNACYASDLPRAAKSASLIYSGDIIETSRLREVPLPKFKTKLKLPFLLWAILVRVSWIADRNARMDIAEAKQRVGAVLDEIENCGEDVLIVSHAALMMYIREDLEKRGYIGPKLKTPAYGQLYVFEKK